MKTDKTSGIALILGALIGLVTMALHPTNLDISGSSQAVAASLWMAAAVHVFAIAGMPVSLFGFRGLSRRIGADDPLSSLALVSYALGTAAVLCAATLSGLVAPAVAREYLGAAADEKPVLIGLLHYTRTLNGAFARVFVGTAAAAILCWSLAGRRAAVFGTVLSALGVVVGVAELGAILSGRVPMNVHGFGLLLLGQAAWTILVGADLYRSAEATP